MKTTHTYAVLEVSREAHDEIRKLLEEAGYQHAFHDDVIDMHGIAIKANDVERELHSKRGPARSGESQ